MSFTTLDWSVFIGYLLIMIGIGIWFARQKVATPSAYFLASGALPWWAVGGSLIASNISTEQILGMNGSGFEIGLAIASYELMAAATLLLVAKFFLPVFINRKIYTIPQFLEMRFDSRVRTGLAVFWIFLYVLVNITSVLYLGGLAIQAIAGVPLLLGIVGLVLYSATFSIMGGLRAVVWTDVIQVVVLVVGGFAASYLVVSAVGDGQYLKGLASLYSALPEKFKMIFATTDTYVDISTGNTKSAYSLLPGLSVLLGGMWIANIYYWGTNQYIIQRALACKSIEEAQKGMAFAAFLKLLMPLIVVIPGIAAYHLQAEITRADEAFPWVLNNYVTAGFKGLVFAALVAAIGSSISSMVNSTSTIFTLDIFKTLRPETSEQGLVTVGKIAATVALLAGAALAPMLSSLGQVFQYIQEYTGFISPGVVAIFVFGIFWAPTTSNAAALVVVLSIPLSWFLQAFFPALPFIDRMGFCFLVLAAVLVVVSLTEQPGGAEGTPPKDRWPVALATLAVATVPAFKNLYLFGFADTFALLSLAFSILVMLLIFLERHQGFQRHWQIPEGFFRTPKQFNLIATFIVTFLAGIYIWFS